MTSPWVTAYVVPLARTAASGRDGGDLGPPAAARRPAAAAAGRPAATQRCGVRLAGRRRAVRGTRPGDGVAPTGRGLLARWLAVPERLGRLRDSGCCGGVRRRAVCDIGVAPSGLVGPLQPRRRVKRRWAVAGSLLWAGRRRTSRRRPGSGRRRPGRGGPPRSRRRWPGPGRCRRRLPRAARGVGPVEPLEHPRGPAPGRRRGRGRAPRSAAPAGRRGCRRRSRSACRPGCGCTALADQVGDDLAQPALVAVHARSAPAARRGRPGVTVRSGVEGPGVLDGVGGQHGEVDGVDARPGARRPAGPAAAGPRRGRPSGSASSSIRRMALATSSGSRHGALPVAARRSRGPWPAGCAARARRRRRTGASAPRRPRARAKDCSIWASMTLSDARQAADLGRSAVRLGDAPGQVTGGDRRGGVLDLAPGAGRRGARANQPMHGAGRACTIAPMSDGPVAHVARPGVDVVERHGDRVGRGAVRVGRTGDDPPRRSAAVDRADRERLVACAPGGRRSSRRGMSGCR